MDSILFSIKVLLILENICTVERIQKTAGIYRRREWKWEIIMLLN